MIARLWRGAAAAHPGLEPFDPLRIANGIVEAEVMVRIVGMGILLGPRAPEAQDDAQIVFEKFRSRHLGPALAEVHLGPVLESRRLHGGWCLEAGRLAAHPALDLLFAEDGVPTHQLAGRPDVAAALEPEVVVEDVAPFEHAHRLTNPFRAIASFIPVTGSRRCRRPRLRQRSRTQWFNRRPMHKGKRCIPPCASRSEPAVHADTCQR